MSRFAIRTGQVERWGAFASGGISGGAFNPAVGIGLALVQATLGTGTMANVWLYVGGPFASASVAALLFRAQNPEDTARGIPAPPPGESLPDRHPVR